MGKFKSKIDWELVQGLFMQGIPPKTIALQVGCHKLAISKHASRHGWVAARDRLLANMKQRDLPLASERLVKTSQKIRNLLANSLERTVDVLDRTPITNIREATDLQDRLESTVRNATKVFGWDKQDNEPLVRIGVLKVDKVTQTSMLISPGQDPKAGEAPFMTYGDQISNLSQKNPNNQNQNNQVTDRAVIDITVEEEPKRIIPEQRESLA